MQGIWLVVAFVAIFLCACQKGIPGDLRVVHDGCIRASHSDESKAAKAAETYFRSEVGVAVKEVKIGYVSSCKGIWVVPISARTDQTPIANLWYVEISMDSFRPLSLERPM